MSLFSFLSQIGHSFYIAGRSEIRTRVYTRKMVMTTLRSWSKEVWRWLWPRKGIDFIVEDLTREFGEWAMDFHHEHPYYFAGDFAELNELEKEVTRFFEQELSPSEMGTICKDKKDTAAYLKAYHDQSLTFDHERSLDSIKTDLMHADVAYLGDHHALAADKFSYAELLRQTTTDRPRVMFMECVPRRHQDKLDEYLLGIINAEEFKEAINFRQWQFRWSDYEPMFRLAKEKGICMVAINPSYNSERSMEKKDAYYADLIARVDPHYQKIVLIGEAHVLASYLPEKVSKQISHRPLILSPASPPIYWHFAEQGNRRWEAVRLGKNHYGLNIASPLDIALTRARLFLSGDTDEELYVTHQVSADHILRRVAKLKKAA